MLEKIKYVNSLGEVVEFGDGVVFANHNDLRDYSWDYDMTFNRITNFRRTFSEKKLPIVIKANSSSELNTLKNNIFEIFEKDVLLNTKGRFYIGEYYYNCFIVEGKFNDYLSNELVVYKDISIVSDEPYWIKRTSKTFTPEIIDHELSFYNYDYPYGYFMGLNVDDIMNNHYVDSHIEITIHGQVRNPEIFIDGNSYKVHTFLGSDESLRINTSDKSIVKIKANGEEVNEFHKRDKAYNIFNKMKSGRNTVSWNGEFSFEITIIEERSEPKWR